MSNEKQAALQWLREHIRSRDINSEYFKSVRIIQDLIDEVETLEVLNKDYELSYQELLKENRLLKERQAKWKLK